MFIKPTPVGAADVQTSPGIDVKKNFFCLVTDAAAKKAFGA